MPVKTGIQETAWMPVGAGMTRFAAVKNPGNDRDGIDTGRQAWTSIL
jgi:hypothetical protein